MADFRGWVKFSLFFSSYIPLWLAMAVKVGDVTYLFRGLSIPVLSIAFLIFSAISAIILVLVFRVSSEKEPKYKNINSYKSREDLLTTYLISYIFPFIGLNYSNISSWIVFAIFFFVLAAIPIPSNHLYVNPVLSIFGYKLYELEGEELEKSILVAARKEDISDGQMKVVELGNNVYLSV